MMVAMNPQTWAQDVREVESGGYLFYDRRGRCRPAPSATTWSRSACRSPRSATPPTTTRASASCSRTSSTSARWRSCWASRCGVIEALFGEQFRGKERLLASNVRALHLGRDFAAEHLQHEPVGLRVEKRDLVGERIFVDGNTAAALGCVYGGATRLRLVPDHAVVVGGRGLPEVLREAARRPGHRRAPLRHRAGRGRDRLDRHGHRRRLERRARLHRHLGPGRVADDRVHRPGLLRRDPGDHHQRAARRAVHRHAHAHAAGRHHQLRLRLARRHQARAAVPAGPARVLRACGRGAGPGRPAADAGVRDDRSGHRHEPAPVRALRLGRRTPLRPRQGDERREAGSRPRLRPLQGRRRRRHPLAHAARHASHQGQLLHPRHHARRVRALLRDRARLPAQRAAAAAEVRAPRPRWCRSRCRAPPRRRRATASSTSAPPARRWTRRCDSLAAADIHLDALRLRAFPFPASVLRVHRGARRGLRRRAEPRRADAQRC